MFQRLPKSTSIRVNQMRNAGMILLNNGAHFDVIIKQAKGKRVVVGRLGLGSIVHETEQFVLKPGPVKPLIKGERVNFSFLYSQGNDEPKPLTTVMARYLSSETVGGFTGVYVGFMPQVTVSPVRLMPIMIGLNMSGMNHNPQA